MTKSEMNSVMQAITAAIIGGRTLAQEAMATLQDQVSGRAPMEDVETIAPIGKPGITVTLDHDALLMLAQAQHESGWRCVAYANGDALEYDLTAR